MQFIDFCQSLPHPEDTSHFQFWGTKLQLRIKLWNLIPDPGLITKTLVEVICTDGAVCIDFDNENKHFVAVEDGTPPTLYADRIGHNLH